MARQRSARVSARPGWRDRHGRGIRSAVTGPHLPLLHTRADLFEMTVAATAEYLKDMWPEDLATVIFEIAGLPTEVTPISGVDRWRVIPAERRVILYRVPIERLARLHRNDVEELDRIVRVPGLANIWIPPIRNRIDMLATGIKSPVGVKVAGPDPATIDRLTGAIEHALKDVPGVTSALAERLTGGRYIDVDIQRDAAARYGLNIADVQSVIAAGVGGENIGETVEGRQRFPINVRYPREIRDSLGGLRALSIITERGQRLVLADVADIRVSDGPPMLRSENARLIGYVYVDIRGRDLGSAVHDMQRAVAEKVKLPAGYALSWSGQFEFLERATAKLKVVVPFTLLIIFVLLYLIFKRFGEALLIMAVLPFALIGGIWLLWLLGYNLSVAAAVGFIALAGVAAEFGVIMLLYLQQAWQARLDEGRDTRADLLDAIREGAVLRVRPKAMTVAVILAGLLPILLGTGTGSEVMQRIAAPMVGGMITAPLLSMFVIPVVYLLMRQRRVGLRKG